MILAATLLACGGRNLHAQFALGSFNPNANGAVRAIVVQPDGKILIGGDFTTLSPNGGVAVTRNRIARLNADGTLDTGFNPDASGPVHAIAVQANGQILVGGAFIGFFGSITIGGQSKTGIARVDATTGLADPSFPDALGQVYALVVQTDGQILAGGNFTEIGGQPRNRIARLNSNGTADSFNPNANANVYAIALQADGKVLAGGKFSGANSIGGQTRNYIARLDATSGAADSFDPNASGVDPFVYAIAVQPDGKILVGGTFNNIGGYARNRIARLHAANGFGDTFDPNAANTVHAIVVQSDGRILAGGAFTSIGGFPRNRFAWLDNSTGLADLFDPGAANTVYAIAVQPNGAVLAGGDFTTLAPDCAALATRNRIARFETGAASWVVTNNNDAGAGSLRDAIATVCPGSTITFASNVRGAINLTSGELLLGRNLIIDGPGANLLSIQRGAGNFRIFNIVTTTVVAAISGVTISNGSPSGVSFGGGISSAGTLTLSGTAVSGNASTVGAGIRNDGGVLNVIDSTLSGNSAGIGGAGIQNTGTAKVINSTISGNSATGGNGGGIVNTGVLTLSSSTISGNSATGSGGGVHNPSGTFTSRSSIIALNTATAGGPDVSGALTSASYNLIGNNSGSTISAPPVGADQVGTAGAPINPLLGVLQDNGGPTFTRALLPGSPAIDKGTSSGLTGVPTTDQRGPGFVRSRDNLAIANPLTISGTDVGAFEFGGVLRLTGITSDGVNIGVSFQGVEGFTYRLERKGALTELTWDDLSGVADVTPGPTGAAQITDPGAVSLGKAFYQVRLLP